jgi:TonB family protein
MKTLLFSWAVVLMFCGSLLCTQDTQQKPATRDATSAQPSEAQATDMASAGHACDEQLAAQKGIAYRVGPGITAPRGIHTPDAKYPRTAVKTKKQGVVVLCLIVTPEGKVDDVRVSRRLSPDLDDSAVRAVGSWTFVPAMKDGKPVAAQIYTEHFFKIKW